MKKNLLLYIIIGFLIVMNGFLLLRHFGKLDMKGPKEHGQVSFIARQLEFDTTQLQKFEELNRAHREKVNAINRDIMPSKEVLFDRVSDQSFADLEIEAITTQIANKEKAKEIETFRFFSAIYKMCNKEQRQRFKKIIMDGLQRKAPQGGNRPPDGSGPPNGDSPHDGNRHPGGDRHPNGDRNQDGNRPQDGPDREHRPPPPPRN